MLLKLRLCDHSLFQKLGKLCQLSRRVAAAGILSLLPFEVVSHQSDVFLEELRLLRINPTRIQSDPAAGKSNLKYRPLARIVEPQEQSTQSSEKESN